MRVDKNGYLDVCRVTYTPVEQVARELADRYKLQINQMIAEVGSLFQYNQTNQEAKRLLAMGMTDLENAALHITKALFTEGFKCQPPTSEQSTEQIQESFK